MQNKIEYNCDVDAKVVFNGEKWKVISIHKK